MSEGERERNGRGRSGGAETILVVDDDEPTLRLADRVLGREGYRVLTAVGGEEALKASSEHEGPIHLLLTDLAMPNMGGVELAFRLTRTRGDTRVVYMSGSVENLPPASAVFLPKPFSIDQLADTVRAALERGPASPGGELSLPTLDSGCAAAREPVKAESKK